MTAEPLTKQKVQVLGHAMAYHESGEGDPILFLHGNPTSSYLWRNVIPELRDMGRLLVPDLIGMGDSEKLPNPSAETYRFVTHSEYLSAFIDKVIGPDRPLLLVGHDWGSALAFNWAYQHRNRVRGIVYMEALVRPLAGWHEWTAAQSLFQGFRSNAGESMILDRNLFVERVLPGSNIRKLSEEEMAEYRRPYLRREDRWPTLTWPRQIPIGGEPADVAAIMQAYGEWLRNSEFPKLFVNADPGAILIGAAREFCRSWRNQTEVTVPGVHFIQEDSGPAIGRAIAHWITTNSV